MTDDTNYATARQALRTQAWSPDELTTAVQRGRARYAAAAGNRSAALALTEHARRTKDGTAVVTEHTTD